MAVDRRDKFITMPGEIEATGISIPDYLKSIIADAPQGDQAIKGYLAELVKSGKITIDDVTFLIDSGVLT